MFKQTILISSVVALLASTSFAENTQRQNAKQNGQYQNNTTTLSTEQKEGLSFMIEEEKVARDVYGI